MRLQWLVWIEVHTVDGELVEVGYTDDQFDITAVVDGQSRTFEATRGAFTVSELPYRIGTFESSATITFGATEEFDTLLHGFRILNRKVTIHEAGFDDDGSLVRLKTMWRGAINGLNEEDGTDGVRSLTVGSLASFQNALALAGNKDGATQRRRLATDKGMDYADMDSTVRADKWVFD